MNSDQNVDLTIKNSTKKLQTELNVDLTNTKIADLITMKILDIKFKIEVHALSKLCFVLKPTCIWHTYIVNMYTADA